ncbi:MAG TPA: hypothetical protein VJ783_29645 [Pirellulales bacterium]|nr:hypothetical protein [Pirellulales bacterium]
MAEEVVDVWFANYKQINDAPTFRRISGPIACAEPAEEQLPTVKRYSDDPVQPRFQVTVRMTEENNDDLGRALTACDDALRREFRGSTILRL